ncbi:S-adenosyl-L-methionine-dependent methyltransferase [Piptocephalis cylindrospora]|uniref:S-adenosyl-L-methionine-dependent methyltransferase n=1 Tax=Piptocephalis cylindrospora TaxID=1907219 RepID=A0A4P9Y2N8_9FUNG|nr:S-adenosyl-L-methionine-dependent methyltransferase [Piptocephalis cylindrospora]|eukprot:RKP12954.1 S-adenosyl-L-methionine-dependent methyltransferase [Piptocephalis cylindrospora]
MRRDIDKLWASLDVTPTVPADGTAPLELFETVEVRIVALSSTGEGIGLLGSFSSKEDTQDEARKGWLIVIPHVLHGEWVQGRVYRNHRGYSYADLDKVLVPAPDRQKAPCTYFGQCGGCQLQHMTYEDQLAFKKLSVEAAFEAQATILGPVVVEKVWASPDQYGYRTKITPHFDRPKSTTQCPDIGFLQQGRRRVLDVEECIIARPVLNAGLTQSRAYVASHLDTYKRGSTILLREDHQIIQPGEEGNDTDSPKEISRVVTNHKEIVRESFGAYQFEFPAGSFFQNNASILPDLTGYVRDHVQGGEEGRKMRFLVDAYCGSGLFSITCASKSFERVLGVEISEDSVKYARRNVELNQHLLPGVPCTYQVGDAETIFQGLDVPGPDTSLIIDPPRKGCSNSFLDQMIQFGPRRVAYVSCNVVTQARDLAYLEEQCRALHVPGWKLEHLCGFDLFPWTAHVEGVALLVRQEE